MEQVIKELIEHTNQKLSTLPPGTRLLISVSGIPGSGKTTLAKRVAEGLNAVSKTGDVAAMIPMDGYHLTRATLSAMPDPIEAHARRGAPFTFDPVSLKLLIEQVKAPLEEENIIHAPSFDHAIKDPVEDNIKILSSQQVLIFEGNYLSMGTDVWGDIARLFDELWFVEVDRGVARERLISRHLEAGLADTREAAAKRADENDLPNGDYLIANGLEPHRVIRSVEDQEYARGG
ncbi:P-loop containing nucleoside triphosphate hydrolase protein [Tuber magnatum]|uniref:P-loop containing nucleoside triphosphate hydrolase protein n=1 Tax=Tuber magnatum TaxID=42249 RepID=A0A317SLT8_9PEZI|nr:P-loop containing nucleoside triphosphate hydrolase protein [Tuber magnatum]